MFVKICFRCGDEKDISLFYRHVGMADGHLNKCIECTKSDERKRRQDNLESHRERDRKRSMTEAYRKTRKEASLRRNSDPDKRKKDAEKRKEWQARNKIKRAAHIITGNAIKYGKLIKQSCEVCGKKEVEAHHDDYSFPLDVRWLCRKHHSEHHKNEREMKRRATHPN